MKKLKLISVAASLMLASSYSFSQSVTLDITAWKGNAAEPAGFPELVKKFEAENPDIKVKLSYISRGDTDVVIPPRLQGGTAPDVMMVDMPLVKLWGGSGFLDNLGLDSAWYSTVAPAIKDIIVTNGKLYVQPIELVGLGNFVNTDLMKQVGINHPPLSVDQLLDACKKLDAAGIAPMLFAPGFTGTLFTVANGLKRSTAKPEALGTGEATFVDDKGFNDSFDIVRDLIDAKCFDPKIQAGLDTWGTSLTEFRSGRVAMLMQGAWNIKSFSETEGLNYTFSPIPGPDGNGIGVDTFGMGWAISSTSKHKAAARKFLDFFSMDENLSVVLKDESAYSPFIGGTNGVPALAATNNKARNAGNIVMWPVFVNHWPAELLPETIDGLARLLLDPKKPNEEIFEMWDQVVEDSL
ncbi:MAG: raffinose/stachyose/melibiose transport system substrate-binding protein [Psychromonas sp.]|jgi:raffinose/stachyose/melibiose transport system substrate-binding protein|uniref:ABC transporter substrate-binding protein n=1 Tax=Psychromonas sp. TaxID=1884585 RepID=UPI0039E548F2